MIAIRVRYMPATATRQARWQATDGRSFKYAPLEYDDEEQEKLKLAIEFKNDFLPNSPELNPIPFHFDHESYFGFYPKADRQKLDELISKFAAERGMENHKLTCELIASFVMQHCVIK
jgi:hypothetical protein